MNRSLRLSFLLLAILMGLSVLMISPIATVRAEAGTDWAAQFYNNTTLTDPAVATGVLYPTGLNFTFSAQPQDGFGNTLTAVAADGWSARYVTTENLTAGFYEFVVTGDDGYRLFIDGNPIINNLASTGLTTQSLELELSGGTYTFVVEHVDISGSASIQVNWFPATNPAEPTATPVPQALGSVVSVNGLAVRTGPFLGASLINVARPGKQYPIVARNIQEGVYTWYFITIDETQSGWVSGRYMDLVQGDENALPFEGSVFDTIGVPPDVGVVGVTRSVMNFRRLPTERSERLGQLDWGAEVTILARTTQGGRDHWYMVRYENVIGWIFAPYVGISDGNILSVPIY